MTKEIMEENKTTEYPIKIFLPLNWAPGMGNMAGSIFLIFIFLMIFSLGIGIQLVEHDFLSFALIVFPLIGLFFLFKGILNIRTILINPHSLEVKYKFLKKKNIYKNIKDIKSYSYIEATTYNKIKNVVRIITLTFYNDQKLKISTNLDKLKIDKILQILKENNIQKN